MIGSALEARVEEATSGSPDAGRGPGEGMDWAGLARMLAVLALIVAFFVLLGWTPWLIVVAAIIVMVMVHELGHFATAKWSGMKVTEYFVGFGPRLWSIRRGETDYGFKPILAGGYVKILGMTSAEEVDPADEPRTYRQQPFANRIMVASAGSFMHFLMAFVLLYGALLYFGAPQPNIAEVGAYAGGQVHAARDAGIKPGDEILAADGHRVTSEIQLGKIINDSPGKPVVLTVERDGRRLTLTVVPATAHLVDNGTTEVLGKGTGTEKTVGLIGIQFGNAFSSEGPVRAVGTAGSELGSVTAELVSSIPHAFANAYHSLLNAKFAQETAQTGQRPQSIVGATHTAVEALHEGVLYLILILVELNIALGILNMLPMLPLDGGHVAIAVYERIRTRKGRPYYQADANKLLPVVYAFVAVLLVFSLSILYLDIAHPVNVFH